MLTGAEIAKACGVQTEILADLTDLHYGEWQGKTHEEGRQANGSLLARWLATPDQVAFPAGESLQDVAARAARILRTVREARTSGKIVLVGHDSVNRVILSHCLGLPLSSYWRIVQDPCCINEIEIDEHGIRLCRMNDTAHIGMSS